MSVVLDYFKEYPLAGDALHAELGKIPALKTRLQEIRRDMLSTCGAEEKSGKVHLVVVDMPLWDTLAAEQATITARLAGLDALVEKLDAIFADAEKQQILIDRKTPKGILDLEVEWRKIHRGPNLEPWNPNSRDKGLANPDLVALLARVTAAMHEAGIAF